MFVQYKKTMPVTYRMLAQAINKDKLAHAYLLENRNITDLDQFVKFLAIDILCDKKQNYNHDCKACSICQAILDNNCTEIKYVYPEGKNIKKEQLIDLQTEFSSKPLVGKKRVYIIYEAEKLNDSSANAILKFLEEPKEGIIAFLITNNISIVPSTIISRCIVIPLFQNGQASNSINKYLNTKDYDEEKTNDLIKYAVDFIDYYEKNGIEIMTHIQRLWHQKFKEKEEIEIGLDVIILFYKEILNIKLGKQVELFKDYLKIMEYIVNKNIIEDLMQKINIVINIKKRKSYNANSSLLIDKFILMMEGEN